MSIDSSSISGRSNVKNDSSASAKANSKWVWLALVFATLLVVAGLALFYYATRTAKGPERGATHKVVVDDATCDPLNFKLPAGVTTFEIHNASRRPLEWEILDGVMVVAERENIAPGFHSLLTVKLRPGTFAITCGLLSNPRGALEVTPTEASEAERVRPPLQAFIGPLSENRVYLITQANSLAKESQALAEAIEAGDVATAQTKWLSVRQAYKRIEAIAGRFADLAMRIDPLAKYLQEGEKDAGFTGFHRLEKTLFDEKSVDGLAPVAQQLLVDVEALKERIRSLQQKPEDLVDGAIWQVQRLQEGAIEYGENPYAQTDLADLQANLDGMRKSSLLVADLLADSKPELATVLHARFDAVQTQLNNHKQGELWLPYSQVDDAARKSLVKATQQLNEVLRKVNAALGME